jgi:hypothetical protein
MKRFFGHLLTLTEHKYFVLIACFKMGLYRQGLIHDLSKFTPAEFLPGVKYFLGDKSPTTAEREDLGYSAAWLHHQGRNRHHFEYWIDYTGKKRGEKAPVQMPIKYLAEMVADRYAACKTYNKKEYSQSDPLNYFLRSKDVIAMHSESKALLEEILTIRAERGENAAFKHTKELIKKSR